MLRMIFYISSLSNFIYKVTCFQFYNKNIILAVKSLSQLWVDISLFICSDVINILIIWPLDHFTISSIIIYKFPQNCFLYSSGNSQSKPPKIMKWRGKWRECKTISLLPAEPECSMVSNLLLHFFVSRREDMVVGQSVLCFQFI